MKHPGEEQLILHYYGEAADGSATIEAHLHACEACRAEYRSLEAVLAAVDTAPLPERSESYGVWVWQRLRPRLGSRRPVLRWAIAVAAMLLLAWLAAWPWSRPEEPPALALSEQVRERILLADIGEHLERAQMILSELANARANGGVDISIEQQRAEDLVGDNRLYRQTAAGAGEAAVAGVLDELEPILLEIAHSPSRLSAPELEHLRERIERQEILFKVRVVGSQTRARERG